MEEEIKKLQKIVEDQGKIITELQGSKQQLDDVSGYINDTSILVNAIMKDPDLAARVQAKITGQPTPPTQPAQPTQPAAPAVNPDDKSTWKFDPATGKPITPAQPTQPAQPAAPTPDPKVTSLDGQKRQEIIDKVEGKFKIKAEDSKTIRPKVGAWLRSYGLDVTEIPVDQLEQKLSDAYLNIGLQTAKETGTTDAVVESYFDDPGKLPGMGSGGADQGQTALSATQKKWAGKLQVPEDKVAAGLKELTETGAITYKPKEQQTTQPVQPSGQPNPPAPTA